MAISRAIALLILLFVLALPRMDGPADAASLQQSSVFPVRHGFYGGACPRLCTEWFDGCNYCSCARGRIDVCTHNYCLWRRHARCARYGF